MSIEQINLELNKWKQENVRNLILLFCFCTVRKKNQMITRMYYLIQYTINIQTVIIGMHGSLIEEWAFNKVSEPLAN